MEKIEVVSVGKPWRPSDKPEADPLYTIVFKGHGEPVKTYDKDLAVLGEHEVESYQSKSGKEYWRIPKPKGYKGSKEFKADPAKMKQEYTLEVAKNLSIQRQTSVKAVVELIVSGKREYDQLQETFNDIMELLHEKWAPSESSDDNQVTENAGDFVKINPTDFELELPPLDQIEEPF